MDGLENFLENKDQRPIIQFSATPENGLFAGKNCSMIEFSVEVGYFSNGKSNYEMAEEVAWMFSDDTRVEHLGQVLNSDLFKVRSIFGPELAAVRLIGHPFTRDLLAKDVEFYHGGVNVRIFSPNTYVIQSIYKEIRDRLNGK